METVGKYIENRGGEDAGMMKQQQQQGNGMPSVEGKGGWGEGREGKSEGEEDTDNSKNSNSSMMLGLLDEFTKIYSDRLQRVEDAAMKKEGKEYLESKVSVLESWVRDLGEQNAVLVATVEELEREAAERVALLEDRLTKMAATTRQSCVSLRDHQIQVSSLVSDKISLEKETKALQDKIQSLEKKNSRLMEENSGLHSDINSLIQVINRARGTGQWETDDLTFSIITPEQLFGPVLSTSRQSSPPFKENQHDYFHLIEEPLKKDNSSAASSFSNLPDMESSTYGGQGSEKAQLIWKLRTELQNAQSLHEDATTQLLERDKQIADLQSQLTEMKAKMSGGQTKTTSTTYTLQGLTNKKKYSNVQDETQLSEDIGVLVSRLAEVEGECQQLQQQHKVLQDSHNLCVPTITRLKEQLNRSHQTQEELRTVLTAEVAQRHDQIVDLHDELKEQEQKHHETQMQLQLKNEIIKDLRKEIKAFKHNIEGSDKTDLTPVKDVHTTSCENKCAETQTYEGVPNLNGISSEQLSRTSSGCYSNTSQSSQVSKLGNELAEKNILLRELQSHLAASRQELHLKDETLYKLEQKLDSSRRDGGEKGERMQYLTSQLTNLQLDVGRTHGQLEQMKRQVENKTELIHKLESENSSLTQQLNDKSSTLERLQTDMIKISTDLDNKKKEASDQRLTISALQEALVSSKRSCDELRSRPSGDVSYSMSHHSHSQQMHNCSNNIHASIASTSVTKCNSMDTPSMQPQRERSLPDACLNNNAGVLCNSVATAALPTARNVRLEDVSNDDLISKCTNSKSCVMQSVNAQCNANLSDGVVAPIQCNNYYASVKEATTQTTSCAFTPDVLSSCSGNPFIVNPTNESNPCVNYDVESDQTTITPSGTFESMRSAEERIKKESVDDECQRHDHTAKVYDI